MLLGPSSSSVHCNDTKDHHNYQMNESQQTTSDSEDGLTGMDVESQRGFSRLFSALLLLLERAWWEKGVPNCRPCWGVRAHNSCFSKMCVSCLVVSDSLQPHSPPGPSVHGIFRQEHWSGLPFPSPKGTMERKKVKSLSRVWLFATPWTVAYQAPPSMEFSRQAYWSGLPFPSPTFLQ